MRPSNQVVPLAALWTACVIAPPCAQEAAPLPTPAQPDDFTLADYLDAKARFYRQVFVADYRTRLLPEEEPDPAVEGLLELYGDYWGRARWRDRIVHTRLLRHGRRALHRSDDPLVPLAVGDASYMLTERAEPGRALLAQASAGLAARAAAPLVQYCAAARTVGLTYAHGSPEEVAAARERLEERLLQAAADVAFAGPNQRFLLDLLMHHVDDDVTPEDRAFIERLAEVEGAQPYPVLVMQGRLYVAEGWEARGSGYADTVTDENWQRFNASLEQAAECFIAAHEVAPEFPEAPAAMVKLCGATSSPQQDLHAWFERATDAQFDHLEAYRTLLWYTMPRWGGSHLEMMVLGQRWARTERFDTHVPDMFRSALGTMALDYDDLRELVASPVVRRTLDRLHTGYLDAWRDPGRRAFELSERVVLLTLMERAEEAARLYQSMDVDYTTTAAARYRIDPTWVMETIEPHFRPHVPKSMPEFDPYEGYASEAPKGRPIPIAAGVPTHADRNARHAAWMERVMVEAYRAHGRRDPRWDADAEGVLGAYGAVVQRSDPAALQRYVERVRALIDAGCDDPAVLYVGGRNLETTGKPGAALELVQRAVDGFAACGYPELFAFLGKRRLEALTRGRGETERADTLAAEVVEHAVAMAGEDCFSGDGGRFYVYTVMHELDIGWSTPMTDEAIERMAAADAIPDWVRHVTVGLHHAARASRAPLAPADAAARKDYFAHVAKAAEHLTAAHALHPEWPEPAAAMVTVAMLEPGEATAREWFDRAVAAELDFEAAYRNYAWSLRPEWEGSVRRLYAFGVECAETQRYDTKVPLWYVNAVEYCSAILPIRRWAWCGLDVATRYEALTAGVIGARPSGDATARHLDHGRLMTAWAAGRYTEARKLWKAAGEQLDPRWLRTLGVEAEVVEADLRAAED